MGHDQMVTMLALIPNPSFFVDSNGTIAYSNKGFHKEFGNFVGQGYQSFLINYACQDVDTHTIIRSKRGRLFHLDLLPWGPGHEGAGKLGILKDVSELKRLEGYVRYLEELNRGLNRINREQQKMIDKLSHQALTDGLTGLYNHRHFWERADVELKRANRYSEPLSCLMIDIDNFKCINDHFDHQFGDRILKRISEALKSPLRATDILARYGGDEFSILLPNTDYDGTHVISKKIMESVRSLDFETKKACSPPVTVSLGVSSYPIDCINASSQLVEYADTALYEAKAQGKDRICFFHELASLTIQ
ncbi:MAG: GGDEF domain-containing protein [bacterium]